VNTSNSTIASTNQKMAERFAKWLAAQNYAASTQRRYFYIAQNLCHYIGGTISLSEVTAMVIGDYVTHNLPPNCSDT